MSSKTVDLSSYYVFLATGENRLLEMLRDQQQHLPEKSQFQLEVTGLHTGDILIGRKESNYQHDLMDQNLITQQISEIKPLVLIERKTISDFCQSFRSNHYQNQKSRMISFAQQTGCRCALVVEGYHENRDLSPKICGIPLSTLEQCFTSIQFRDNFFVKHVENQYFHAEFIIKLLKSYEKYQLYQEVDRSEQLKQDYLNTLKIQKKANLTPESCYQIQLSAIPDISLNMAQKISEIHPNLKSLMNYLETNGPDSLSEIKVGKNRLGKIKSQKIHQFLLPPTKINLNLKRSSS